MTDSATALDPATVTGTLLALEQTLVAYDEDPAAPGSELVFLPGSTPVLLSAPHTTRHQRGGRWKREEEYTAAFVHWLHEQTGAHVLYATRRLDPDPHDDDDLGSYKAKLRAITQAHDVRLLLDIHGARGDRDFAIALGTIFGETCRPYEPAIIAALAGAGFQPEAAACSLDRLALNPPRYAGGARRATVTRFAWRELGIPAVQVEINSWVRIARRLPTAYMAVQGIAPDFRGDAARIRRVLAGLAQAVRVVNESA